MSKKIVIDGLDGFRQREGQHLFSSEPFEISKQRIQEFCRSIANDEWIHWDEERLAASPLGNIIMPAFMAPALMSWAYFSAVEFINVDGLFQGTDKIRLLQPVKAGQSLVQHWRIERVEERSKGIAVYYDVSWSVPGNEGIAGAGTFIVRYW